MIIFQNTTTLSWTTLDHNKSSFIASHYHPLESVSAVTFFLPGRCTIVRLYSCRLERHLNTLVGQTKLGQKGQGIDCGLYRQQNRVQLYTHRFQSAELPGPVLELLSLWLNIAVDADLTSWRSRPLACLFHLHLFASTQLLLQCHMHLPQA